MERWRTIKIRIQILHTIPHFEEGKVVNSSGYPAMTNLETPCDGES